MDENNVVDTPKPQAGTWILFAPDGRKWEADSPLKVVSLEQRERVPAAVALERIAAAVQEDQDAEAEMRRLLTFVVVHSNMRRLASEGFLEDARRVLGISHSAFEGQDGK